MIDQRCADSNEAGTDPVKGLDIELLLRLQFDKPHRRARCCFCDRLGITIIVLLRLNVRANIFWWHKLGRVALSDQLSPEIMSAATSLHCDDAGRQFFDEARNRSWSHPPPQYHTPIRVQSHQAAAILTKIDTKCRDIQNLTSFVGTCLMIDTSKR